tara:strand:+ start:2031 stop:2468 length:438 start_codon:yes stop_codon:yes gene_type:complete
MQKKIRRFRVEPMYKKSVVESEFFTHSEEKGAIEVTVVWRGGEYFIDIEDDNINELTEIDLAMKNPEEAFEVSSFENWELDSTWDGCSEDIYFHGTELDEETFEEAYSETGWEYLVDEQGWQPDDCEVWIQNGVKITEEEINEPT